jgi:uncharacterized membrane protein YraQ (UPF0718 family)
LTQLVKKGVAIPIAITFMLTAPIINPIVIISTLYAFPNQPEIALLRVVFGTMIALIVGLFLSLFGRHDSVLLDVHESQTCHCGCHLQLETETKCSLTFKLKSLVLHAGEEFFNVGKYLILGAFMTSLIRTIAPKTLFLSLGTNTGLSLFFMMAAAFLFSACSTSDAFIARSFVGRFSVGAIMGFLVFGPMMDLKNILMLLANFKKSFVAKLVFLIFIINFLTLYLFLFVI